MGTSATRKNGGRLRPPGAVLRGLPALVALTLLMVLPSLSWAQNPSLDQYVESVPTSEGDRTPKGGGPGGGTKGGSGGPSLPRETREQIQQQGGADAPALEAVATAPGLGAPESSGSERGSGNDRHRNSGKNGGTGSGGSTATASSPGALDAVATAATGSGSGAGPWLLLSLVALTAAAGVAALVRRRSDRP